MMLTDLAQKEAVTTLIRSTHAVVRSEYKIARSKEVIAAALGELPRTDTILIVTASEFMVYWGMYLNKYSMMSVASGRYHLITPGCLRNDYERVRGMNTVVLDQIPLGPATILAAAVVSNAAKRVWVISKPDFDLNYSMFLGIFNTINIKP